MGRTTICAGVLLALAGTATGTVQAQEVSLGFDASVGVWANANGGSGLLPNGGLDGVDRRTTGRFAVSAALDFGAVIGQLDLKQQGLEPASPALDDDDATQVLRDATLRLMRDFGGLRAGLFLGKGRHDDYGDSDLPMGYDFQGLEASAAIGSGAVFGQVGRFDSFDEFDEGIQDASFVRLGGAAAIGSGYTLSGAVSYARGLAYGVDPARVKGLELSLQRAIEGTPYTVYASYDYTRIEYWDAVKPAGKIGDTFGTVWIGMRIDLGSPTKRGGALPEIGRWVAYRANEIE